MPNHTISWTDPQKSARDPNQTSGFDYLCAIRDGIVPPPPIASLIGYKIRDVEEGRAVFELSPAEYHFNPFSTVHGGIAGLLLDTSMTAAVLSTLPVGYGCTTIEFKVNLIKPMTIQTGPVSAVARRLDSGKRVATAEGCIVDQQEALYARALSTLAVFPTR